MKNAKQKKLGLFISAILGVQVANAQPQGAQVVQGSASISTPNSNTMNITNSNNAVINWQKFNIGAGQTTNFIQPSSSSSVLNRVISNAPSQILGNLNSNGQVFLINQNGILVGEGARINTNGFFASTLNITNEDYLNGNLKFTAGANGTIENQGYIHAGEDGNVVLIAPNIENGGVIEVENGNIILAAGESITITSLDNSSVEFQVQSAENHITNLGSVIARNGAANLFAGTLKHTGTIRATGLVRDEKGIIRLVALDKNEVSGSVDVSGDDAGYIEVLGDHIDIQQGANIDASSNAGAGEILIGGDQQGLNPNVQNATSTTVAVGAQIHADGIIQGDGGKVIVFAKDDVHIHGDITAKGGNVAGDGGFIETSGLKQLDITAIPDASANNGKAGDWLIDPNNITIQATTDLNVSNDGYGTINSIADGAVVSTSTIVNALSAGTNVIISTQDQLGSVEAGDITVASPIAPSGVFIGSLTLNAHNDINVNADIGSAVNFNITLNADSDGLGGGVINLGNAGLNAGASSLTLSGNAINVNGNSTISNNNSLVTLNAPLTIAASANLTFANNGFTTSTTVNNNGGITNNGTITINNNCGDGCSIVSISGGIENNGTIDFIGGVLSSTGTINLNAGTVLSAATPTLVLGSLSYSRLTAAGTLNPNISIIADPDLELGLSNGTINSFENIKISKNFVIEGGVINFGADINLPQSLTTKISNLQGPLILNAPISGAYFILNGATDFTIDVGLFDINLNNTNLVNGGIWSANVNLGSTGIGAGITGANSTFNLLNHSVFKLNAPLSHTISVPVISQGAIELVSPLSNLSFSGAGGLNLKNGGRLSGVGTYIGNVIVDSGGQISPGLYGNARDNTGILNIVGNVSFNARSVGIWEIDDDGLNLDQLNVTGNVNINNADIFLFWDTLISASPVNISPANLILATGAITSTTPILHDLPAVSGSLALVPVPALGSNALQYTLTTIGTINRWTGLSTITPTLWSDSANWSLGVPALGQTVVIESATTIDLSVVTANLGNVQLDANLNINAGGSLNGSGVLSNLQDISLLSNSSVAGTGVWNNLRAVHAADAITISRTTFNNYADFRWDSANSTSADFVFTGASFKNLGTVNFVPFNNGNLIDFSGSINGLNNAGLIVLEIGSNSTDYSGTLNNTATGVLNIISPNSGAILNLATSNTNNGEIFLKDTALSLNNGVTFSLTSTSNLTGTSGGVLNIAAGSTLDVAVPPSSFAAALTLDLNGGTIANAQNLTIPNTFNITGGTITGLGTFTTPVASTTTYTGSLAHLNVIMDWVNNGTFDFASTGFDLILDGTDGGTGTARTFTNNGTFNLTHSLLGGNISSFVVTGNIINNGVLNYSGIGLMSIATDFISSGTFDINSGRVGLPLTASFSGATSIASGSTLGLSGTQADVLSGASFSGSGDIVTTTNLTIADGVSITPLLKVNTGAVNFEGAATITSLNLVTGIINVDTLGASSTGDTLTVTNLKWDAGTIAGDGSANLLTTGTSNLVTGTLENIDWINSGTLNWSGINTASMSLINAVFTNAASGVFNVNSVNAQLDTFLEFVQDGFGNKSITTTNSTFNNEGTINLVNSTLDLNGGTLNLNTSTAVLNGSGTLVGNVNNSDGLVSMDLGQTVGSLQINGNYLQGANGTLKIRIVDPINGVFRYDTFAVTGLARLGGTLEIAYFSNQVTSITESFNPFTFANRNGVFDTLVDTNGNILAVDISNGGFTIIGSDSQSSDSSTIEVVKSQEDLKEIIKALDDEGENETLDFIKEILAEQDDEDKKKRRKKQAKKLVCK